MSEPMIRIKNLTKTYESLQAGNGTSGISVTPLRNVSLDINRGDIIAVIGPSGTGKSTLIRMINRLETPTSGSIIVDGEDITAAGCRLDLVRQKIGMIFQSFNLFAHLTVIENIMAAPVSVRHISRQEAYDQAMTLLKSVGLQSKALSYPSELSGGQQQRIAIVRALAMQPELLLFDEPTSALDPTMVGEVESVIRRVAREGTTMMIVTHGMDFARSIANRVIYMDEGGIYEEGTPEQIFDHPQRERTRQFIHRLKVLTITIDSRDVDTLGCNTLIEEFAAKNDFPRNTKIGLRSIFDEVCIGMLLLKMENPLIRMTTEYSTDGNVMVSIDYNGDRLDITQSDDDIALAIVKGHTTDMVYTYNPQNAELPNHLELSSVY